MHGSRTAVEPQSQLYNRCKTGSVKSTAAVCVQEA